MWCLSVIGRDGWDRDMSMCWLELPSSHGVGEEALSAVWHQAGLNSDRPYNKIIVVEYYYILNKILLLAEGT